jgi:hypothetical protein
MRSSPSSCSGDLSLLRLRFAGQTASDVLYHARGRSFGYRVVARGHCRFERSLFGIVPSQPAPADRRAEGHRCGNVILRRRVHRRERRRGGRKAKPGAPAHVNRLNSFGGLCANEILVSLGGHVGVRGLRKIDHICVLPWRCQFSGVLARR